MRAADVQTAKYRLYRGDSPKVMAEFAENSIDCVVTSPPYGVAKEYETNDPAKQLAELLALLDAGLALVEALETLAEKEPRLRGH